MTDALFDITQQGGVGRQPVTNVGRVVYNLQLDQDDLEQRKHRGAHDTLWPQASMEDRSFWVLPREICLAQKIKSIGRRRGGVQGNMISAFSSLNGIRGERDEIIENLTFVGVAGGPGAKFDTKGNEPRFPEFTGILGGLYTITNNGPDRIQNGDLVYWDLPPATALARNHRDPNQNGRVTAVTKPYRPSENKASARVLERRMRRSIDQSQKHKYDPKTNKLDGAADALMHFAFSCILIGAKIHRAQGWTVEDLAARLGMITGRPADEDIQKLAVEHLTADSLLFARPTGRDYNPVEKELNSHQQSALDDAIAAMEQGSQYVTDRIFCKALTPASANGEFVATFGHYRQ